MMDEMHAMDVMRVCGDGRCFVTSMNARKKAQKPIQLQLLRGLVSDVSRPLA